MNLWIQIATGISEATGAPFRLGGTHSTRCFIFGGGRVHVAVAAELLRAVSPMAIEAATEAERRHLQMQAEQQRVVEFELQQARYEASLAERRYAACVPRIA